MKVNPTTPLRFLLFICMASIVAISTSSCQKELKFDPVPEPDHNIRITFIPVVGLDTDTMHFGQTYTNGLGVDYTVTKFKFYLHGIQLINTDSGKVFEYDPNKHFLIDFEDEASTVLPISVLPFKYNRIAFKIGVDSSRNLSGAQTEALDPTHGMFWTWSTGYIMAKLEGTSPASTSPSKALVYHIGGFQNPYNVIKKVTLLFPFGENVDMKSGKTTEVTITADVNDWFKNPHDINISTLSNIMTAGTGAMRIAENYSKMFTVTDILNE